MPKLQIDLDASDDHALVGAMKAEITYWAGEADRGQDISKEVLSYAKLHGLYRDVNQ